MWTAAVNEGSKRLPEHQVKSLALKLTSFYGSDECSGYENSPPIAVGVGRDGWVQQSINY
jgi:hypothetical protein